MPRKDHAQINLLMRKDEWPYTYLMEEAERLNTTPHMVGRELWGERTDLIRAGWRVCDPALAGVLKGVAHLDKKRYQLVRNLVAEHLAEIVTKTGSVPDSLGPRPPLKPGRKKT